MEPDRDGLDRAIRHLASFERGSASAGERRAAEWIAARLRDEGLAPRLETAPALGGYWQPLGALTALAVLAGALASRSRPTAVALAAFAGAGVWDELGVWRHWFRRVLGRRRTATNVVAVAGDPDAEDTLVVVAHHDAAHSGLVFHPAPLRLVGRLAPGAVERARTSPPLMWLVLGGPVLVGLGAALGLRRLTRAGTVLSAGSAASFADIASRAVVPGANDNLSGVAVVLALARSLREEPVAGLRVVLVSTGAEESFEEGMQGFARRWFPRLDPARTDIVVVDTVGSRDLTLPEREGMVRPRPYDAGLKDLVAEAAGRAGVRIIREHNLSFGSDALIGVRHGFRTCLIGSMNELKAPANYHWPTDDPDHLELDSVLDAARLVDEVARTLSRQSRASRARAAATASARSETSPA